MDGCITVTPARHTARSGLLRGLGGGHEPEAGGIERLCAWAMISLTPITTAQDGLSAHLCTLRGALYRFLNSVDSNNLGMLNGKLCISFWASCITVVAYCLLYRKFRAAHI